ncbi:MAG: UpxY family transcription antiterminator [Muribaculum sp.]|nr:UpxY family transcription antiterminator [Muribaculum sp.]
MIVTQPSDMHSSVSPANVTDDREARSKFWIAAYTRPKSEKKVAAELSKHINTYVATQTLIKQWSDRKKKVESVVIPMIIFAEVSSDNEILTIKKHPLILKVLTLPGQKQAAHIPAKQIERLKFMLNEADEPVEFIQEIIKVSDFVKVVKGNLKGLEGIVQYAPAGKAFLVVTIDILGGAKVSVNLTDLELIDNN